MTRYLTLMLFLGTMMAQGQSYSTMNSRFARETPTAEDTAAYINQGEQKVRTLFDLSGLYYSNSGRSSNQAYIQQGLPDYFYVPEEEELNIAAITALLENASENVASVEVVRSASDRYLATITTTNTDPPLVFELVLVRTTKKFGNTEEPVWDVLLTVPKAAEEK